MSDLRGAGPNSKTVTEKAAIDADKGGTETLPSGVKVYDRPASAERSKFSAALIPILLVVLVVIVILVYALMRRGH